MSRTEIILAHATYYAVHALVITACTLFTVAFAAATIETIKFLCA